MPECRDLQFPTLRNTCITNMKLYKSKLVNSPSCNLCPHPFQNSEHRFYNCPQVKGTWDFISNLIQSIGILQYIDIQIANFNFQNEKKNSFLTILVNCVRKIIDRAHCMATFIHPNSLLYQLLNISEILKHNTKVEKNLWTKLHKKMLEKISKFNPTIFTPVPPSSSSSNMLNSDFLKHH